MTGRSQLPPEIHVFADLEAASTALARWSAERLEEAIAARGKASLAVPGGSTPQLFLEKLGQMPLDWGRITVLPTDERLVPLGHARANDTMIRTRFAPVASGLSPYLSMLLTSNEERAAAARRLHDALVPLHPIDVVVSGMGEDAHVCSLFPGDTSIDCDGKACALVVPADPPALEPRLSLSPAALAKARHRALLFSGASKRITLEAALASGDYLQFPVLRLMHASAPLQIFAAF